jgi:ubiquinone/menaquinone biosynthesis C-methylase UbiE
MAESEIVEYWDAEAANFDTAPDHGLLDNNTKNEWISLLTSLIPIKSGSILDMGCGTGTLSIILSNLGYQVTGIDLSPNMINIAQQKALQDNVTIEFIVGNARKPTFPSASFDLILARHIVWALPEYKKTLKNWSELLKPGGYFVLIEGYWITQAGIHQNELIKALPSNFELLQKKNLSSQELLWGKAVNDERYVLVAKKLH